MDKGEWGLTTLARSTRTTTSALSRMYAPSHHPTIHTHTHARTHTHSRVGLLVVSVTSQTQRAVEKTAVKALQQASQAAASGGLYDWESLDVLQQLMYGDTDISPAALKEELGEEIAQIYTKGARPRDAEDRYVITCVCTVVVADGGCAS